MLYLQHEIAGVDPSTWSGEATAEALDKLDKIAKKHECHPFGNCIRPGPDIDAEELAGNDPYKAGDVNWVPAADGLKTVRVLLEQLKKEKTPSADLITELEELERVFEPASRADSGFYFSVYMVI